jgi:hypothetical protein
MEFLMSYGWALLVVLLVIAALAYFGMLNPDRFLPDKFELPTGISVRDVTFYDSFVVAMVSNGLGKTIYDLQLNLTACGTSGKISPPLTLAEGESKNIYVSCLHGKMTPLIKSKFKSNIIVNYTTQTYGDFITHKGQGYTRFLVSHDLGMIGYWPMDNDEKDNSGNGLGGTIVGTGVTPATGKVNNGYSFNGVTGNYISINLGEDIGNSFTMAAWFYPRTMPAAGDYWQCIVANAATNGDHGIWTYNLDRMDYYADGIQHSSATIISANRWYHAAITYDGTNGRLYINGVLDSNYPQAMAKDAITTIYIGSSGWPTELFDGVIDEVVVFKRVLNNDEIKALYTSGTS